MTLEWGGKRCVRLCVWCVLNLMLFPLAPDRYVSYVPVYAARFGSFHNWILVFKHTHTNPSANECNMPLKACGVVKCDWLFIFGRRAHALYAFSLPPVYFRNIWLELCSVSLSFDLIRCFARAALPIISVCIHINMRYRFIAPNPSQKSLTSNYGNEIEPRTHMQAHLQPNQW